MSARGEVELFLERLEAAHRPDVWTHLVPAEDLLAAADAVDEALAHGADLPLAGVLVAVKDNIDVAGCPTTAAAPSYSHLPDADAPAVARLRAAGAVIVGKTNMDQFATGLVGTRSPYGVVSHAEDPTRISGGSSSGSGVAVALGLVPLALGTDTAGSGRVPAALHGIWGLKPTRGIIPTTGVVPACWSLDVVTAFARDPRLAALAIEVMSGSDGADPRSERDLTPVRPAGPVRVAIPTADDLDGVEPAWIEAFHDAVARARGLGWTVEEVSLAPLLEAATMLYGTAFVAERYAAVGEHIAAHSHLIGTDLDPTVSGIVLAGKDFTAAELFDAQRRLAILRAEGERRLAGFDAVLTPTTAWHPTIAQVQADPIGANARMGLFTNFANLCDMAAVALPSGRVAGLPFGVMLTGPAMTDAHLLDLATALAEPEIDVFVVGAHRRGQPLHHELASRGARLIATAHTAPSYRFFALATTPPKPGLVRVGEGEGVEVSGEVYRMSAAQFGHFVNGLPKPMGIGEVLLSNGVSIRGFICEPVALEGAQDISDTPDWAIWRSRVQTAQNA